MLRYVLKRRTGGKNKGRTRGGRRACAVIKAARAVGGTGDSGGRLEERAVELLGEGCVLGTSD